MYNYLLLMYSLKVVNHATNIHHYFPHCVNELSPTGFENRHSTSNQQTKPFLVLFFGIISTRKWVAIRIDKASTTDMPVVFPSNENHRAQVSEED